VYWGDFNNFCSIGFNLNDGQSCKFVNDPFEHSHTFDSAKKITRIEVMINKSENAIRRISFYSGEENLVHVSADDWLIDSCGGRVETIEIAADQRLIGCELDFNHC